MRNKILTTYMGHGESYPLRQPDNYFGIVKFRFHGGTYPWFIWETDAKPAMGESAVLKVFPTADRDPVWHYRRTDMEDPIAIAFKDERVRMVADVVKAFAMYYPFPATDNFLQTSGDLK